MVFSISVKSALVALVMVNASLAFQSAPGTPCSVVGHACEYSYEDPDTGNEITAAGFCAPDNICADNGATCSTDDNCYDYCGTDGICGGLGAACNTQAPFFTDQFDTACYTPAFTCTTEGTEGTCIAAASAGSSTTRHKRKQERAFRHARDACSAPGEEICPIGDVFECINTFTNLEACGGCPGSGSDCTLISNALQVDCVAGACVVAECMPGFELEENNCVSN